MDMSSGWIQADVKSMLMSIKPELNYFLIYGPTEFKEEKKNPRNKNRWYSIRLLIIFQLENFFYCVLCSGCAVFHPFIMS